MSVLPTVQPPTFRREDDRGVLIEVINKGPWETVLTGSMHAGGVIGNHYHKKTRMYLYMISGSAAVHVVDVETARSWNTVIESEQGMFLEPNTAHALRFREESTFLLLKSRKYSETDPDTYPYSVLDVFEVKG